MVDAVLAGGEPEINDTSTYDKGVKVVPSYLLEPVSVNLSTTNRFWSDRATKTRISCNKLI